MGLKIDLGWEEAGHITVAYLENDLEWWSANRGWTKEEKKLRKEYLAALKAILKILK